MIRMDRAILTSRYKSALEVMQNKLWSVLRLKLNYTRHLRMIETDYDPVRSERYRYKMLERSMFPHRGMTHENFR